jgi:phage terminase large subunit GpA-like protein
MLQGTSQSLPNSSSEAFLAADLEELERAWKRGITPDPELTVSEWADQRRILSSRAASEPGQYRTARAPFNRDIMNALSASSPYQRVVFMKSTQVGASEDGINWIGYSIDQVPAPFMLVQPTTVLAKRFSQQRIDPMIESTPVLRQHVQPARMRDSGNTVFAKAYPGGILIITGANSAVGLRSMPARFIMFDEVDAYPPDVDEEGDPIKLAERRATTFGHRRKFFIVSTPTIKGLSRIEMEYEATDQRRYFVPCPHCGRKQWLKFERLLWDKGDYASVRYMCEHCNDPIEEHHKTAMLDDGEWIATADCSDPKVVGFHISALYSPVGWMSWAEIAKEWEEAQGNEALIKTFKNTIEGVSFQEKGEAPDWKLLADRKREHLLGSVPTWAILLTAGVDVQRDRIEADIYCWGYGLESALVDHIVVEGDTARDEVWDKLTALLFKRYTRDDGTEMLVVRWAVDTGDGVTTSQAYAFCRRNPGVTIAIKGRQGFNAAAPVQGPSMVEITERGRKIKKGLKLFIVYVDVFKSETYRFLRLERPTDEDLAHGVCFPDGYIHIPDGIGDEWLKQLTAEQLVLIKSKRKKSFPRMEWQKLRERNEALDLRVYARAAAWLLQVDRWALKGDAPKAAAQSGEPEKKHLPPPAAPEAPDEQSKGPSDKPPPSSPPSGGGGKASLKQSIRDRFANMSRRR